MIRKVFLDKENYIIGFTNQLDGKSEYDLPQEVVAADKINCWQLKNGKFILDTDKYNSTIEKEKKDEEISMIKKELATYDYIGIKIATGVATKEEYAKQIAYTEILRTKIRELEK